MAFRFRSGQTPVFWRSALPRLGVRGSLFAAFAVIAGMAIVIQRRRRLGAAAISAAPWSTSAAQDIPRLAASLQLSAQSASLASQGPALLASPSEDTLDERTKKMKETQQITPAEARRDHRARRRQGRGRGARRDHQEHRRGTQSLVTAARERLEAAAQHDKQYDALRAAQAAFVAAAEPGHDGRAEPGSTPSSVRPISPPDDATEAAQTVEPARQRDRQRQSRRRRPDRRAVGQQQRRARRDREGIQGRRRSSVKSNLDLLPKNASTSGAARMPRLKLLALGEGKTSVFKLRQKELDATDYGQTMLRRGPQAQCRPRHQRAAARRAACRRRPTPRPARRARRFRSRPRSCWRWAAATLLGSVAVRLALCRRQHPAPHRQPAALDAAACPTAISKPKSTAPASTTRSRRWPTRCRCSAKA